MKKYLVLFIGIIAFSLFHVMSPVNVVHAATFESGTYDISFELKEAGNNNTSIADGYFSKPATLIVKNGVNYIQLTTTESDWVKSISGPHGSATVISESGDTRTVQFEVGDLSNPVKLNMHVVVPEEIAGMEYDNQHSVRAVFNTDGVPAASTESGETTNDATESMQTADVDDNNGSIKNPKTGDTSPISLYISLLFVSIGIFTVYKIRVAKS